MTDQFSDQEKSQTGYIKMNSYQDISQFLPQPASSSISILLDLICFFPHRIYHLLSCIKHLIYFWFLHIKIVSKYILFGLFTGAFYFYFTQYLLCFNFSLAAFNIFLLSVSLCVLLICLYLCFQKILNLWFDFYYNLRKLLDRISSASLFFLQNLNDMYRFHWLCSHSCSPAPGLHH